MIWLKGRGDKLNQCGESDCGKYNANFIKSYRTLRLTCTYALYMCFPSHIPQVFIDHVVYPLLPACSYTGIQSAKESL